MCVYRDTGKQKKQPTDMSPFIEKLEAFWMKGMQACRTDEEKSLVSQAAAETGLNRRQIIVGYCCIICKIGLNVNNYQ